MYYIIFVFKFRIFIFLRYEKILLNRLSYYGNLLVYFGRGSIICLKMKMIKMRRILFVVEIRVWGDRILFLCSNLKIFLLIII